MTERAAWELIREQTRKEVENPTVKRASRDARDRIPISRSSRIGAILMGGFLTSVVLTAMHMTAPTPAPSNATVAAPAVTIATTDNGSKHTANP